MRILVVSNFFPPHYAGGYELACADVVEAMRARGHHVAVLTSSRGLWIPRYTLGAVRLLRAKRRSHGPFWIRMHGLAADVWNRAVLAAAVRAVRPDVIHVFNQNALGGLILDWLHSQTIPVVHDIFDTGLLKAYKGDLWFENPGHPSSQRRQKGMKDIARAVSPWLARKPAGLNLRSSYFRSHYLRNLMEREGLAVRASPVIYHGVRCGDFPFKPDDPGRAGIILAGRLTAEKGVHVFLDALRLLPSELGRQRVTIVGGGAVDSYAARLRELAGRLPASFDVRFTGQLPHSEVIRLLGQHAIFVFPVIWEEPFGIILLESMAAGLCVVGTRGGGAAEILVEGKNCVVVAKDNAQELANALHSIVLDDDRRLRLAAEGHRNMRDFELGATIDRVEAHLEKVSAFT